MKKNYLPSGVSIAIRKTMASCLQNYPLIIKQSPSEFSIKVANTLEERAAVFHLGYQTYLAKGYIKENPNEWLIQDYDRNPETLILMVKDNKGAIVGSVTLVFNGSASLPVEKIFDNEIKPLKTRGEKIAEISRLVLSPDFRNSKEILVLLFNYLAIYTYHIKHYDSLTIQVNPRHKNYYKKLLKFEELGEEKLCPSVQNAPAVLLYLPLSTYRAEVNRCSKNTAPDHKDRSLYPYCIKLEQEKLVAFYLKKQEKPITPEEKIYFGFSETTFGRAVCI